MNHAHVLCSGTVTARRSPIRAVVESPGFPGLKNDMNLGLFRLFIDNLYMASERLTCRPCFVSLVGARHGHKPPGLCHQYRARHTGKNGP